MTSDNKSSHISSRYDEEIGRTIPYYREIHDEVIAFVRAYNSSPRSWLDTGCGTGSLAVRVLEEFGPEDLVLADPSGEMLAVARTKLGDRARFLLSGSASLDPGTRGFDVVTAIQCHHYEDREGRAAAIKRCHDLLGEGGLFITFENTRPRSTETTRIMKRYWELFQVGRGKTPSEAASHLDRFDTEFFPITVEEHLGLLSATGFRTADCFWKSYMQAGFFGIK